MSITCSHGSSWSVTITPRSPLQSRERNRPPPACSLPMQARCPLRSSAAATHCGPRQAGSRGPRKSTLPPRQHTRTNAHAARSASMRGVEDLRAPRATSCGRSQATPHGQAAAPRRPIQNTVVEEECRNRALPSRCPPNSNTHSKHSPTITTCAYSPSLPGGVVTRMPHIHTDARSHHCVSHASRPAKGDTAGQAVRVQ